MPDERLSARELEREVLEFHRLYCAWLRGEHDDPERVLQEQWIPRCHPQLAFVMPGGSILTFDDLLPIFEEAHGSNPAFATDVRAFTLLHADRGSALVRFEEWHRGSLNTPRPDNGRLSSVLFTLEGSERVRWRHLQQTWLPDELVREEPFEF